VFSQELADTVSAMFEKALADQFFAALYAKLCVLMHQGLPAYPVSSDPQTQPSAAATAPAVVTRTFKRLLLDKCQVEFEAGVREVLRSSVDSDDAYEMQLSKQKRRMLANIRFVGELFRQDMLTTPIMNSCIEHLLGVSSAAAAAADGEDVVPLDEDIEALCKLLETVGKKLDVPANKPTMDRYFSLIKKVRSWSRHLPSLCDVPCSRVTICRWLCECVLRECDAESQYSHSHLCTLILIMFCMIAVAGQVARISNPLPIGRHA